MVWSFTVCTDFAQLHLPNLGNILNNNNCIHEFNIIIILALVLMISVLVILVVGTVIRPVMLDHHHLNLMRQVFVQSLHKAALFMEELLLRVAKVPLE